uniref:Uncharacterized protein n=1 Tax=Hemiselmis tepida TaxID=464990 RepID=A0A6T6UU64_9CRYP|mmetsp:Transcript_27692/g.70265  ORF Transcript_27692/g.70265 Transcript_27692/m.70265 type:complete len:115 (+) Transcript_27692:95-439(+)
MVRRTVASDPGGTWSKKKGWKKARIKRFDALKERLRGPLHDLQKPGGHIDAMKRSGSYKFLDRVRLGHQLIRDAETANIRWDESCSGPTPYEVTHLVGKAIDAFNEREKQSKPH